MDQAKFRSRIEKTGVFSRLPSTSGIKNEKRSITHPWRRPPDQPRNDLNRLKRLFSILIEHPMSIDIREKLSFQDDDSLCRLIHQMRGQLVDALGKITQIPIIDIEQAHPTQTPQISTIINETCDTTCDLLTPSIALVNESPYELDSTATTSDLSEIFPFPKSDRRIITRDVAESTVLNILEKIYNMEDLFAMATVNKILYRI